MCCRDPDGGSVTGNNTIESLLGPAPFTGDLGKAMVGASARPKGTERLEPRMSGNSHWPAHPVWTGPWKPFSSSTRPCSLWAQISGESLAPEERAGLTADVFLPFVSLVSWGHPN